MSDRKKFFMIVESPKKAKTISGMFSFPVLSTKGHIEKVVSFNSSFEITFSLNEAGKQLEENIVSLKDEYICLIASDPDREGEQMADAIFRLLCSKHEIPCVRIIFSEISKKSIEYAINNPVSFDKNMVLSQNARVIVDRMIGFDISSNIQKYLGRHNGCGRIQTLIMNLIIDRHRAISNFISSPYFHIHALYGQIKIPLQNAISFSTHNSALEMIENFNPTLKYKSKKESLLKGKFRLLLNTVDVYNYAFIRFHFDSKKTSLLMQNLFEGIKIDDKYTGLISYPRSDSRRINVEYQNEVYMLFKKRGMQDLFKINEKNLLNHATHLQDAHECIHPVDLNLEPIMLKDVLSADLWKLYDMIYTYTLSAFCIPYQYVKYRQVFVNTTYQFINVYYQLSEAGYLHFLPHLMKKDLGSAIGEKSIEVTYHITQHRTLGPSPYKENQIINFLFDRGIGRPSSYANIMGKLVEKNQIQIINSEISPTQMGYIVDRHMQQFFHMLFNVSYTGQIEEQFNLIKCNGREQYLNFLQECQDLIKTHNKTYGDFIKEQIKNAPVSCYLCGAETNIKTGRYGTYIICPNEHKKSVLYDGQRQFMYYPFTVFNSINRCPKCDKFLYYRQRTVYCSNKCGKYFVKQKNILSDTKYMTPFLEINE